MADDNYDDEIPHDPMAGMANAMIILTGLMMLGAWLVMNHLNGMYPGPPGSG